jgi:hypothetical protein
MNDRKTMQYKNIQNAAHKRYRLKYPEKRKAHMTVMLALLLGTITKEPCRVCGYEKAQAHHPDYSQPLMIEWYCDSCHKKEHQRLKKERDNGNSENKTDTARSKTGSTDK